MEHKKLWFETRHIDVQRRQTIVFDAYGICDSWKICKNSCEVNVGDFTKTVEGRLFAYFLCKEDGEFEITYDSKEQMYEVYMSVPWYDSPDIRSEWSVTIKVHPYVFPLLMHDHNLSLYEKPCSCGDR